MATSVTPEQQAIIDRNKAAQEAFKARTAAAATRESVAWGKAASVAKAYLASAEAPIFLPFKDRDGQYVPCLVIGGKDDFLRAPNGDVLLDPKSREQQQVYKLTVWVFSAASVPFATTYDFDANAVPAPAAPAAPAAPGK